MRLAELAEAAGLDGVVCSGHEVAAVHRAVEGRVLRRPRPAARKRRPRGDQKRVVTPRQARDGGASVLVIGRPIAAPTILVAAARAIEATCSRRFSTSAALA